MEELRRNIIDTMNKSGLPLDCIYYIIKDVYRDTLETYNAVLKDRKEKEDEQQAEDGPIVTTSVDEKTIEEKEEEKGE